MNQYELRTATKDFLNTASWKRSIACTLTLKQRVNNQKIDTEIASRNFRHFLNRLNRKLYGNAADRYSKHIKVIPVIEHDEFRRFHIHLQIELPRDWEFETFTVLIRSQWEKTRWAYHHIHFELVRDRGWISYLTKPNQKRDFDLSIDWMNCQLT